MDWKPEFPRTERRTREEKKAKTKERLLEAAHKMFSLKGYEGTTVDDIASAAGYTRGAFYAHFANKEAIMEGLINRGFEEDLEAMAPMGAALADNEALKQAFGEYGRRFEADPTNLLWSLEFQLASLRHPELRSAYREQYHRLTNTVADMIETVMGESGHANPEKARELAPVFVLLQTGLGVQKLIDPEGISDDLRVDAFEVLLRGMQSDG